MKKTVFALCVCVCVLLSGCSGVSQEAYNSAISLYSELESKQEVLEESYNSVSKDYDELKNKYDELSSDNEKLKQDNEVLKKENESLNSSIAELENAEQELDSENQGVSEFKKDYILSLGYGTYTTKDGSTWHIDTNDSNSYVAYLEDLSYNMDNKAALNIFSDMADIIVNGLQIKSQLIPSASFFICKPDGTLVASAMIIVAGEEKFGGFPLFFFGEYEYLNYTEATQMVRGAWSGELAQSD